MATNYYIGSVIYPIKGSWHGKLDYYQLFYMGNSSSIVTYNGQSYQTPARSIYLMYPNVKYEIEFDKTQESLHYWIAFFNHGGLTKKLSLLKEDFYQFTNIEIFQHYFELALTFRSYQEFENSTHSFLLNFLDTYINFCLEKNNLLEKYPEKVLQAISYFRKNFSHPINLKSISEEIFISPEHLIRLFKKCQLPAPMSYLRELRAKRAIELMQSTSLSMKEISRQVGVPDPYQFSKLIKKISGHSGRELRLKE